jgi:hypothetical protein
VAKKGHTEEQILRALRQAEGGTRVAEICREHGISFSHRGPPPLVCSIIQRSIPSLRNRQSVPIRKLGILPCLISL